MPTVNAKKTNEENRNAIQETLYLNSISGMAKSIIAGGETPIEECLLENDVEW